MNGLPEIKWSRTVPVRYEADIAVIGGGIAGVCAACAAAREGARVILVERFAVAGGNATAGGVGNWSGETRGQGAIFDEIISMQEQWGAVAPYPGPYKHFSATCNRVFDHEILAVILQELLLRYGVHLLLHTRFVDVRLSEKKITEALICGQSGPEALKASIFIDCTGEAQVARAAGFTAMKGRESDGMQLPPSMMCFVRELSEKQEPQLPKGWFSPFTDKEGLPMTSVWPNGEGSKALKIKTSGFDSTDTESMSQLEIKARRRMFEVLDYFQRVEKKPWKFDHCSPVIGLREGRRVAGNYILNIDDVRNQARFDDAVAKGVFYLDGISPDNDKRVYILSEQEQSIPPYQIPLRSLIARDGVNLMMAGRCFSSDQHVLSSARVMTTCAMTGQAAGLAAATAYREGQNPDQINPDRIRKTLERYGANLDI